MHLECTGDIAYHLRMYHIDLEINQGGFQRFVGLLKAGLDCCSHLDATQAVVVVTVPRLKRVLGVEHQDIDLIGRGRTNRTTFKYTQATNEL